MDNIEKWPNILLKSCSVNTNNTHKRCLNVLGDGEPGIMANINLA